MAVETGKNYQTLQLKSEQEKTLSALRRRYGILAQFLFLFMDIFYGKERRLSKFKVLEVIARVPYQSWEHVAYIAMTHTYAMPHFARRIFEFIKEARAQQDNEQWHLLILEEMIQKKNIRENFFLFMVLPQAMAFIYYHISWFLYVIKPAWSYGLNADFEDHAEHEYMEFVKENPEWESEPFESDFKEDYGNFANVADLFRRIGLDERLHKEESLNRVERARFSVENSTQGGRGGDWVVIQMVLLLCLLFTPDFLHAAFLAFFKIPGALLFFTGLAFGIPSVIYLGRSGTPFPVPAEHGHLVQSGPYRLVRHPVYFSAFLVFLGWGFWSENLIRIIFSGVLLIFFVLKSKYEEELLQKAYPEYSAYQNSVPRKIIPWLF